MRLLDRMAELGTPKEWVMDLIVGALLILFACFMLPLSVVVAKAVAEQTMETQP